ncbi:MAG: hypothetical protein JW819_02920 [Candidatus Krumholzibacteriota bacterium]|nr:hypothetical protein [Candidatus Krumholzibacteriota bacterium]
MKAKWIICVVAAACLVMAASSMTGATGRVLSYQGFLMEDPGGPPLEGTYDLTFAIYPDSLETTELWTEAHADVPVTAGIFSVILGETTSLTDALFEEAELWVGVTIAGFDEIQPRMRLASVPWAFRSAIAEYSLTGGSGDGHSLDADDGDPVDMVYVNSIGRVGIATTDPHSTLDVNGAIRAEWWVDADGYRARGNFGGFQVNSHWETDDHVYTDDGAATMIQQTGDAGGLRIDVAGPGLAGEVVPFTNAVHIAPDGHVGIGCWNADSKLRVTGTIHSTTGGFKLPDGTILDDSGDLGGFSLPYSGSTSSGEYALYISNSRYQPTSEDYVYGIYGRASTTCTGTEDCTFVGGYFESSPPSILAGGVGVITRGTSQGLKATGDGFLGVGVEAVGTKQGIHASASATSGSGYYGGYFEASGGGNGTGVEAIGSHTGIHASGTVNAGSFDGNVLVDGDVGITGFANVSGTLQCGVLVITGGADISEGFDVDAEQSVRPGMIVAIDPANPGRLRVADSEYDRCVAGIVSGANGINPGMVMGQDDSVADGEMPVALSGRVYCCADACGGPIAPGDLLTSSPTPGHVMKVSDHARAQGAIVGKAMTGLAEGRGMILVLVTLQ